MERKVLMSQGRVRCQPKGEQIHFKISEHMGKPCLMHGIVISLKDRDN